MDRKNTSQTNDKLIAAKEQWARDGRGLTDQPPPRDKSRLPPGQRLTDSWPVLDLGILPRITTADWTLTVDGAVETPLTWDWGQFMDQPQTALTSDIHCVTTWSRYDNDWIGVSARHLLHLVRPLAGASHLMFHSYDGYTTNVPLGAFDDDDVLLAHSWQGQALTADHGGPVRVVIPKLYFWKSAKWLRAITVMQGDQPGYWEVRGYHDVGDPWDEQRYR